MLVVSKKIALEINFSIQKLLTINYCSRGKSFMILKVHTLRKMLPLPYWTTQISLYIFLGLLQSGDKVLSGECRATTRNKVDYAIL